MRLPIPAEVLSQHTIVLGKTRSGKSSKMRVLVEWLLEHKKRVVIITPKDDWWGLRSHADGKSEAFPIVIFGGRHEDVPLNPRAGAQVAELIATGNRPCLITFFRWPPSDRTQFYNNFMAALFAHHRGELYVVIDEVHNFAPKGKVFSPQAGMMLHWSNTLASEGQGQGLIMLAASQRPQKVHNDLLTSCETLIACRVIHKADRDAIKDWIDGCADPDVGKQVLADLASMGREDAWCWSPEIGFGPKRVTWPLFATYDSFRPQEARSSKKLKGWAEIDLEEVRAQLQSVVAEAEANDPKKLHARIAQLEKELRKGAPAPVVHAPGLTREQVRGLERAADEAGYRRGYIAGERYKMKEREMEHKALRNDIHRSIDECMNSRAPLPYEAPKDVPVPKERSGFDRPFTTEEAAAYHLKHAIEASADAGKAVIRAALTGKLGSNGAKLPKAHRQFLQVLAQRAGQGKRTTRNQVAIFAGYAVTSGHVDNVLGALRSAGYAEGGGDNLHITEAGLAAMGDYSPLPTGAALREYWFQHAGGKAPIAFLKVLCEAYPNTMTRDEVAEAANYEVNSGHVDNTLGRLRSLELVTGSGKALQASAELFG